MTSFKDHVFEPCRPARRLDSDNRRSFDRRVKRPYLLNVVSQLQSPCLTRPPIAPRQRLLMWMKIDSNVNCHYGFSCQRARSLSFNIDSSPMSARNRLYYIRSDPDRFSDNI